jgi:DNA-binding beta-propeller fold protein YncE
MVADLERLSAGGPPRGPAGGLERGSTRWLRTAAGLALAAILVAVLFAVRLSPHRTPPSAAIVPGPAILPQTKPPPAARAASARFRNPVALAVDRQGHLLVCDKAESAIYQIMPDGTATLLAGRPQQPGGEDGVGSAARFSIPRAVASAGAGRWFVADADDVRSIGPGGAVSTWAGALGQPGSIDGPGPNARLDAPSGLALDPTGTLWVADRYTVRAIDRNGVVRMVAGSPEHAGHRDGPRGTARFSDQEKALAVDAQGGIYLADTINHMIRKVGPDGNVRAFAGAFESGSADGPGSQARFSRPAGIAVARDGTVFVADAGNHDIRRIAPDGRVTTLAGCAGEPGSADGLGPDARFRRPMGLALAEDGTLFVADTGNGLIRRIARDGTVATIAVHF